MVQIVYGALGGGLDSRRQTSSSASRPRNVPDTSEANDEFASVLAK
jgi:hypothetical protein